MIICVGRCVALAAVEVIDAQVRDAVRRRGIDPSADPGAVRGLVEEIVRAYDERSLTGAVPVLDDLARTTQHVYDAVAGYGLLQRYFDDPTVEEIWINEPGRVRQQSLTSRHHRIRGLPQTLWI
jgi:pilus assembly protein CpaF